MTDPQNMTIQAIEKEIIYWSTVSFAGPKTQALADLRVKALQCELNYRHMSDETREQF